MISSTIITLSIKNLNFGDVLFQLLGGFFCGDDDVDAYWPLDYLMSLNDVDCSDQLKKRQRKRVLF